MSGGHSLAKFPEQSEGGTASIADANQSEHFRKTRSRWADSAVHPAPLFPPPA
ncbi:hypothetical protein SAMN05518849_108154 [Sphingobium sp. AP50]|nr:hypothetical protein SAMN05518849_108154 [Sphingobium sp. AP50]